MELPKPPEQAGGSFWFYGQNRDPWDIVVKVAVWAAALAAGAYFAWAVLSSF